MVKKILESVSPVAPDFFQWKCGKPHTSNAEKGYKEKHHLVVVNCSDESHDGDEQQEEAHCDDSSDDVDARHQAEPLPPCCHSDQQQADQLWGAEREEVNQSQLRQHVHLMEQSSSRG